MRAWSEMFNAFLAGLRRVRCATGRRTPTPTTSPTSTASRATTASATSSRSRGIRLPEGDPEDPPSAETVCGLGNRKNDAFNAVLERDGVEAYPGLGRACSTTCASSACRSRSSRRRPTRPRCSRPPASPTASAPSSTAGSPTERGLPGKPAPDTFVHAAEQLGAPPRAGRSSRGRRVRRAGRRRRRLRPRHRGRPRRRRATRSRAAGADVVVTDLAELAP